MTLSTCESILFYLKAGGRGGGEEVDQEFGVGFPGGAVVKNLPAIAEDTRDLGSISGLGRSPKEGNGNPLQYSCLENPMDGGAWRATVHGVAKSQTGWNN